MHRRVKMSRSLTRNKGCVGKWGWHDPSLMDRLKMMMMTTGSVHCRRLFDSRSLSDSRWSKRRRFAKSCSPLWRWWSDNWCSSNVRWERSMHFGHFFG
jgi:hypothetical protein